MTMDLLQAVILAVIQGVTEWLPVSSSGHLAVTYFAMGIEPPLMFNLAVHLGTLAAVIMLFRKDLVLIMAALPCMLKHLFRGRVPPADDPMARMGLFLVVGTIPAALGGYFLKSYAEDSFSSPMTLSVFFILTGIFLFSLRGMRPRGEVSMKRSVFVGIFQIASIFPGISRSGMTIGGGLHCGIRREEAARFSFLLSIPLIGGAALYEALSAPMSATLIWVEIVVGAVVAFVVGALTIKTLMGIVKRGQMHYFAPYCLALGVGLMLWSMFQ
ncbi:MAG: undecaprenyl-diphosphate phosphatase [Candidatus Thermoplasmatota archaeon]|nr:undecaprenyl-diphosphate phosphatase [Candidatus Thermoplasmatota archaeon]